jgi:hypothetical protein
LNDLKTGRQEEAPGKPQRGGAKKKKPRGFQLHHLKTAPDTNRKNSADKSG